MGADVLGNPVTTDNEATLRGIDDFVEGFMAYETRAAKILPAADGDASSALANAYAGLLWMMLEAPEAPARAARYLERAKAAAVSASRRERLNVDVLEAWVRDDITKALALCDQIAAAFPRDLAMVKISQYLNFNLGRCAEMLRIGETVFEVNRDVAYMHGMMAFAYEQCHLLDEAEAAAREAIRLRRKEPWAQHALAHVMITQGRIDEGAAFLESVADTWTDLNSFMITHLWWHLALFYLSQGKVEAVLDLYDRSVWGVEKDYSQDQVGAVSLLARLELAGVEVGDRWEDLAEHIAGRGIDTTQPFLTMQYLYGLAKAGRPEADALMAAVRERARTAPPLLVEAWRDVALPACEGLLAHAREDYVLAERQLTEALPRLILIGGSHAQRDLFEQVRLDAVLMNGKWSVAQQLLEQRRANDRNSVPVNLILAEVYKALDLPREASNAKARALATLTAHHTPGTASA
ncbi:MAG: tetratricopeptide repeat protein [Caulobacteraceae bacterium]|nr:tetratricopeptide repeat protein [Caulobacteraceae bacterium]